MDSIDLARRAREALLSKKAANVTIVNVGSTSPVADYYVIASGDTGPQLKAMMNAVQMDLKHDGTMCYRRSGVPDDGWVVLDYFDVVIHIFLKELRDYYAIEELWAGAPQVP